jgi:hypothetical protein
VKLASQPAPSRQEQGAGRNGAAEEEEEEDENDPLWQAVLRLAQGDKAKVALASR